jgi:hypothetical protein
MPFGVREAVKVFIGSAAVSLAATFLTAALATYGIIDVSSARILLLLAGVVLVAGITTSDYFCARPPGHVLKVGLVSMIVVGGLLVWLDHWAIGKRAEIEARTSPPSLPRKITTPPKPPELAFVKTPKMRPPTNVVTGNQNVTGNVITQGPGSALSFNQQGGITAGTVNIDTKDEWKLTDDQKKDLKTELSAFTGPVEVSFVVEAGSDNANAFAQELALNIFNLPGWKADDFDSQVGPILPGITIESATEYNPPAALLQKRLQEMLGQHIPAVLTGQVDPPKDKYVFTLFIRRKK